MPGMTSHGVSAIDSNVLLTGRPHGGCSILWKTSLICKVKPVDTSNCRVFAIIVELLDVKLLLANCYMPIDSKHDRHNLSVYDDDLAAIAALF